MKKHLYVALVTLLSLGIAFSCKKSSTPATPATPATRDYAASIKDKTWWGMFAYTGKTPESYSIYFGKDNTILWSELSGNYGGAWVVNDKQLTITFSSGAKVSADISDDNKLSNIVASSSAYKVNSGALVANPNLPLDNTVWKGSLFTGAYVIYQMNFMPGLKVELKIDNMTYPPFPYTRLATGGAIRIQTPGNVFFGVVTSDKEMKGANGYATLPWEATKQ
jgi:hypothetical protein